MRRHTYTYIHVAQELIFRLVIYACQMTFVPIAYYFFAILREKKLAFFRINKKQTQHA